jgi:hypothetical protein
MTHAGVIMFDDSTPGMIGYTDTTGRVLSSTCPLGALAIGESCIITYTPPGTPSGSSSSPAHINIFDGVAFMNLSDTLEITELGGVFTATYLSGHNLTALSSPARSLTEINGMVQTAFTVTWFGPNSSVIEVDTIDFISEPHNGVVPEPASLALLGIGLAGLCAMRRRKA